jgi:hypothetical protein
MHEFLKKESRKWCGHSCWRMHQAVDNNNNAVAADAPSPVMYTLAYPHSPPHWVVYVGVVSSQTPARLGHQHCSLLHASPNLLVPQAAVVPALTGSGLFQVMLEGTLLLLGVAPAGYPQPSTDGVHVFDYLSAANDTAIMLGTGVGNRWAAWCWHPFTSPILATRTEQLPPETACHQSCACTSLACTCILWSLPASRLFFCNPGRQSSSKQAS